MRTIAAGNIKRAILKVIFFISYEWIPSHKNRKWNEKKTANIFPGIFNSLRAKSCSALLFGLLHIFNSISIFVCILLPFHSFPSFLFCFFFSACLLLFLFDQLFFAPKISLHTFTKEFTLFFKEKSLFFLSKTFFFFIIEFVEMRANTKM